MIPTLAGTVDLFCFATVKLDGEFDVILSFLFFSLPFLLPPSSVNHMAPRSISSLP
jgi:hypothetical protein